MGKKAVSDSEFPPAGGVPNGPYASAPDPDFSPDILESRWLHKLLVAAYAPADWPGWLIGGVALLPIAAVAGLWWLWLDGMAALYLAVALTFFVLSDAVVLVSLPRWRLSFGPVGPQLFALELPRLAVGAIAVLMAAWVGPVPALVGVMVINLAASLALAWGALVEPLRLWGFLTCR